MLSVAIVQEAYSPSPSDLAGGKRADRADDASPRRHNGEHPDPGRHPVQRSEFRLSRDAGLHRWPAPNIGQHTVQVCEEFLGMSRDEIDALVAENVLEADRAEESPPRPLPDVG